MLTTGERGCRTTSDPLVREQFFERFFLRLRLRGLVLVRVRVRVGVGVEVGLGVWVGLGLGLEVLESKRLEQGVFVRLTEVGHAESAPARLGLGLRLRRSGRKHYAVQCRAEETCCPEPAARGGRARGWTDRGKEKDGKKVSAECADGEGGGGVEVGK